VRFLADENVEQPIVDMLRREGHDVVAVAESQPGLGDSEVLRRAETEGRILLTNDKDFGELVSRLRQLTVGIVLLRLGSEDGAEKAARLRQLLPGVEGRLEGHFTVVTDERVRVRPLGPWRGGEGQE
jgi:predicted nuclease of predicted toxin-antitoxin system